MRIYKINELPKVRCNLICTFVSMGELPQQLLAKIKEAKGFDESLFLQAHSQPAPISIRLNPFKLTNSWQNNEPVLWCEKGRYLTERPSFTIDPLFHAGCYYVQEASSMFLEQALKQSCDLSQDIKVLDLCGAPGGKSTLIASLISPNSLLVANEVIAMRAAILDENLSKWGNANTHVTNNDPSHFGRIGNYFDVIVADAPCSGSGLFRKDPKAIDEWSEGNVKLCSERQKRIIADVLPALKQDGVLIYSTCSYSKEENEDMLDWMQTQFEVQSCKLEVNKDWGIVETQSEKGLYGYRFYPDKVKGEGFFIACLRKTTSEHAPRKMKSKGDKVNANTIAALNEWIQQDEAITYIQRQYDATNTVHAIPTAHVEEIKTLANLNFKKVGVSLGAMSGTDFIPEHSLALSLLKIKMPTVELDLATAHKYLRKDTIACEGEKGWNLATYQGIPLGWIKILNNRTNNYYPKNLRILKDISSF